MFNKEIWYCSLCRNIFDKPDINQFIDIDGKKASYQMCTSCEGWNVYKIEYSTGKELYDNMRLLA